MSTAPRPNAAVAAMTTQKGPNQQREDHGIQPGVPAIETKIGRVPLHLDSLDQRLDLLMGVLRELCQKISPVVGEGEPSETETAVPAQNPNLSAVASRISHMDDQVLRMINEVRFVSDRVEL